MTHERYNTDALVLSINDVGESAMDILLFTKDLGLVSARATGIRLLKSRMRSSLLSFNKVQVSLVNGRFGYKLVGTLLINNFDILSTKTKTLHSLNNIINLILKLVPLNEVNNEIFNIVDKAIALASDNSLEKNAEILITAQILVQLGYLDSKHIFKFNLEESQYISKEEKQKIILEINKALNNSQLV